MNILVSIPLDPYIPPGISIARSGLLFASCGHQRPLQHLSTPRNLLSYGSSLHLLDEKYTSTPAYPFMGNIWGAPILLIATISVQNVLFPSCLIPCF